MFNFITNWEFWLGLISGGVIIVTWGSLFYRRERRLFKNVGRPVGIVATAEKPMTHEAELLKRVGFFNIGEPSADSRAVDLMNGKRLIIIGYSPTQQFRDAFEAAKQRETPVIVYAGPTRVSDEDMVLLQDYSNHSLCNTPLRLISDVFTIMSTYPEDK